MGREEDNKRAREIQRRIDDAASARLLDRFGRPILAAGSYYVDTGKQVVFVVDEIKPMLDPKYPAGLHRVVLTSTLVIMLMANQRNDEFTLIDLPRALMAAEDLNKPATPASTDGDAEPPAGGLAPAPDNDAPAASPIHLVPSHISPGDPNGEN